MNFDQDVKERYREILGSLNTTTPIIDQNTTNNTFIDRQKRLQIQINTSGFDQLIYFYNKNETLMVPLTNSSTIIRIDPEDEIGLLGVFDTSETVAMTINYLVTIADYELIEKLENETGLAPIIIFVIVICSIFGFILLLVACFFTIRVFRG